MELNQIDLNLLVLFNQLVLERRVSKVAETLGLTQPAVSNSLAKLRRLFGDELFLRTPSGMVPTPFAEQLAEPVGHALAIIHGGLNQQTSFDPTKVKLSMTIGMTDIGEIVFLSSLDGIAPRLVVARYGARYLEHEPSAHRILSTIRRSLITALRLHQRHDEAQLLRTAQPGRLSPAAARRLGCVVAAVARPSRSNPGADGSG